MRPISLSPSTWNWSAPSTTRRTRARAHVVEREVASNRRTNGPIAQEALLSFALREQQRAAALEVAQVDVVAERRADRLRRATRRPARSPARGCSTRTSGAARSAAPQPTADIGCALVKTSASGPMPTSRYCDQSPRSISAALSAIGRVEPGCRPREVAAERRAELGAQRFGGGADRPWRAPRSPARSGCRRR